MVVAIILLTILLTGCGNAPTTQTTDGIEVKPITVNEITVEETVIEENILTEDIIEEDIIYWDDVDTRNAKALRRELADKNLYFEAQDGKIYIWGVKQCYDDNKYMAIVDYDESTQEINKIAIADMVISKQVYDILDKYTNEFTIDAVLN